MDEFELDPEMIEATHEYSAMIKGIRDYMTAFGKLADKSVIKPWLTVRCPECDESLADVDRSSDFADDHMLYMKDDQAYVIVGCEGYYVINPAMIGIESNWADWTKPIEEQ